MATFRETHGSLLVSLLIHGGIVLVLFFYLLGVDEHVENLLKVDFFGVERPAPKPRRLIPKPVVPPAAQSWSSDIELSTPQSPSQRTLDSASVQRGPTEWTTVTRFANEPLVQEASTPSSVASYRPSVPTAADIPPVDSQGLPPSAGPAGADAGLGLLGQSSQLGGEGGGTGFGRGDAGSDQGSGRGGNAFTRAALSFVSEVNPENLNTSLAGMTDKVRLGGIEFEPLPLGVPGGRIVGHGRDIRGVVRFGRIQHRLADWWFDSTSLTALVHFMNNNTQIRTDMNVEGGSLKLTDIALRKSPIVFMTGHDPALQVQIKQLGQMSGALANRLTDSERLGLRDYLLAGGLLFFDDCGLNSRDYPLMRIVASELRAVLPEYPVTKIPNRHELYDCLYPLGGPAWGAAFIWKHGPQAPIKDYLEGMFIDGKIAVILSGRDYLCAAQTIQQHAGKVHKFVPAYRMMTNAVVYALSHGSISDYQDYVPLLEDETLPAPKSPPPIPVAQSK